MKYPILIALVLTISFGFTSQKRDQNKQVLLQTISEKYDGETKKGLANGQGKALGEEDSYEGTFRKGYPHGEGIYIWGNGNKYTGEYSKGKRDGKGELRIKRGDNLPDSIQVGYFKEDEYIGIYKEPYKIVSEGGVRNVTFDKKAGALNQLSFEVYLNGAEINYDLLEIKDKNNTLVQTIGGLKTMTNANFPLERVEASFTVDKISYKLIFDLYEKGNWSVIITV